MFLRFSATASLSAFKAKSFNLPIAAVLASISLRLASIAGKTLSLIPSDNALIFLV